MADATAVRERPILFTGEMVRAILDGRKTQTRRVVKQPLGLAGRVKEPGGHRNWHLGDPNAVSACPYGQPGGRLWVRETWAASRRRGTGEWDRDSVLYRADPMFDGMNPGDYAWNWAPSLFMPRWASRLTLEVTGVRVERLQQISEADAQAEGVKAFETVTTGSSEAVAKRLLEWYPEGYRANYKLIWDSINAKRGLGWDVNPWVWVIEFRRSGGPHAE